MRSTVTDRLIHVAHSPDSDDAFMFYALAEGAIDTPGLEFRHELADIETLNRRALAGELEVTAVSIHAYAHLADRYLLLTHGASMGEGYGPRIVSRQPLDRTTLAGRKVAIPGELTSANLALRLYQPGVVTEVVPFDRIIEDVAAGAADAGVVIHEGQLTFQDAGLTLVEDLGRWWGQETGGLPLPLGGNVIRRDLGPELVARVSTHLRESIAYALAHPEPALEYAMRFARGLGKENAREFVGMYVNRRTLDYGPDGRRAVQLFLDRGFEAGIIPRRLRVEFAE
ncbi:MAG: ABC transporter substrate-binding protein [Gemmatimonadetes bacterium]|nr:ABC transporter substrate-binding protein [Gemmatimonadota bacterium]